MTTPPSKRPLARALTRYTISMLDMTTYRRSFLAESDEEALAMADADQEQNGTDNWQTVASSTEFEIISEEPANESEHHGLRHA